VYRLNHDGLMELQAQEHVLPPADVPVPSEKNEDWCGAGSGWRAYAHELRSRLTEQGCPVTRVYENAWPEAIDVLTLALPLYAAGKGIDAARAIPTYLRDKVAKSTAERASSC